MHVSIDCRYIRERPSGIGAYVKALVDRIPALAPDDRFQLWLDPRAPRPVSSLDNVTEAIVKAPANSLRTLAMPSRLADLSDVDVLHATFNLLGRGLPCASVVTIHDLMWLVAPRWSEGLNPLTPFQSLFYRDGIVRALRQGTRFVAISKATADSMCLFAPDLRTRTRVIHHGIEPRFRPPEDREAAEAAVRSFVGIDGRYLLVVGQNAPSKNHGAVLEAFAAANLPPDVHLVLLQRLYQKGRFGLSRRGQLHPRAVALGLENRVHWLPRVTDDQVIQLLHGTLGLIQFSRFEGFGMPALEAAACGTPVIASDIAPLVEVLGGAGLHVPLEVPALAKALHRVATEPNLRTELSERGIERAKDFSWDRSAAAHLELYREAASSV